MTGEANYPIRETVDRARGEDIVYTAMWIGPAGPAVKVWLSVDLDGVRDVPVAVEQALQALSALRSQLVADAASADAERVVERYRRDLP